MRWWRRLRRHELILNLMGYARAWLVRRLWRHEMILWLWVCLVLVTYHGLIFNVQNILRVVSSFMEGTCIYIQIKSSVLFLLKNVLSMYKVFFSKLSYIYQSFCAGLNTYYIRHNCVLLSNKEFLALLLSIIVTFPIRLYTIIK